MAQPLSIDEGISLAPTVPADEPINLSSNLTPASPPSEEVATRRADKTSRGLGSVLGVDQGELRTRFIQGQEDNIRKQAALSIDTQNRLNHVNDMKYMIANYQGAVTPAMYEAMQKRQPPPTDPDMVIEKEYTKNTLSALNTAATSLQGSVWTDALKNIPTQVDDVIQKGSDFGTKREFLQTWLENANEAKAKQSWPGRIFDEGLQLSQLYPEFKLRGTVEGAGVTIGGLSSDIKNQADTAFKMDNETFKKSLAPKLQKMIANNPSLAASYIEKLLGESDKEAILGNVFTMLAIPDLALGVKGLSSLGKRAFEYNHVQKAVRDTLAEARKPNATAADIQAAAGDLGGSAVKDVSQNVMLELQGTVNPGQLTAKAMTANFANDIGKIGEGTPRNREIATRMQDQLVTSTRDIPNVILTMNKTNRTPLSTAVPENIEAIRGVIKQDYRGPWNSLLNVDINKDSWNPFTNTWDYKLHIGNMNGEHFSNPQTAANFAKDNGFGAARILQGTGTVESEGYAKQVAEIDRLKNQRRVYLDTAKKYEDVIKDLKSTAEAKKQARADLKILRETGIAAKERQINELEASLVTQPSTARLAEIRSQLEDLKGLKPRRQIVIDGKKVPSAIDDKIKELEQEMRALNYGKASAIPKGPVIRQQGVGYYIEITRPLDETMPVMRDLMIKNLAGDFRKEAISDATSGISGWKILYRV
jgi:hypothetical protein